MTNGTVSDGLSITGRVDRKTYSISELESRFDSWESKTKKEKLQLLEGIEPVRSDTTRNVLTERFLQYLVDNLDSNQSSIEDNVDAAWVAFGDDGSSGTDETDTDLNNRIYSEAATESSDDVTELAVSVFIGSNELNNTPVDEIGLFTGDPANLANEEVFMINHASFATVTKNNDEGVTFTITLTFENA